MTAPGGKETGAAETRGEQPGAAASGAAQAGVAEAGVAEAGVVRVRDVPGSLPVERTTVRGRGRLVTLRSDTVRMNDGGTADRDVIEHPGAVSVVALDAEQRVLLIRQYRHAAGRTLWEIPAGLRDVDGEPLRAAAARELAEEAGWRAADWHTLIDFFPSPGVSEERARIFLARDLTEIPAEERDFQPRHEEADILVRWVPLETVLDKILAGEISNANAVAGTLALATALRRGLDTLRPADAPET